MESQTHGLGIERRVRHSGIAKDAFAATRGLPTREERIREIIKTKRMQGILNRECREFYNTNLNTCYNPAR